MRATARARRRIYTPVAPALKPPFVLSGLGIAYSYTTPGGARVSADTTDTSATNIYSAVNQYPNGTLLQAQGDPAIYVMQNGQRSWIPNLATFNALGYSLSAVVTVPVTVLDRIPQGPTISAVSGSTTPPATSFPNGTLLQAPPDPTVYLITGGIKYWIPDVPTLNSLGYSLSQVQSVSPAVLASIPAGAPIPSVGIAPPASPTPPPPVTINLTTPAPPAPVATPVNTATVAQPVITSTIEPGAVYNATVAGYVNPDGSIVYAAAPTSAAGTVSATIEPGATYNSSIGAYVNPDGSIVYAASASTAGTFDITSPSTWPLWVWGAIAAGVGVLALMKKR